MFPTDSNWDVMGWDRDGDDFSTVFQFKTVR